MIYFDTFSMLMEKIGTIRGNFRMAALDNIVLIQKSGKFIKYGGIIHFDLTGGPLQWKRHDNACYL